MNYTRTKASNRCFLSETGFSRQLYNSFKFSKCLKVTRVFQETNSLDPTDLYTWIEWMLLEKEKKNKKQWGGGEPSSLIPKNKTPTSCAAGGKVGTVGEPVGRMLQGKCVLHVCSHRALSRYPSASAKTIGCMCSELFFYIGLKKNNTSDSREANCTLWTNCSVNRKHVHSLHCNDFGWDSKRRRLSVSGSTPVDCITSRFTSAPHRQVSRSLWDTVSQAPTFLSFSHYTH